MTRSLVLRGFQKSRKDSVKKENLESQDKRTCVLTFPCTTRETCNVPKGSSKISKCGLNYGSSPASFSAQMPVLTETESAQISRKAMRYLNGQPKKVSELVTLRQY